MQTRGSGNLRDRRRAVHSTPSRLTSMLWQLANTICGERNL